MLSENSCVQPEIKLDENFPILKEQKESYAFATHVLVKAQCCAARMPFARE